MVYYRHDWLKMDHWAYKECDMNDKAPLRLIMDLNSFCKAQKTYATQQLHCLSNEPFNMDYKEHNMPIYCHNPEVVNLYKSCHFFLK